MYQTAYYQIGMSNPEDVAKLSCEVISKLQTNNPGTQVASLGALFILICEYFNLNMQDVLQMAGKIMRSHNDKRKVEFKAIEDTLHDLFRK